MDPEYRKELKQAATWFIKNGLDSGPLRYQPPTQRDADAMRISPEEAVAIYDEAIASLGLVEVEPGLWWFKNT
jgi:hypothetical protein